MKPDQIRNQTTVANSPVDMRVLSQLLAIEQAEDRYFDTEDLAHYSNNLNSHNPSYAQQGALLR